MLSLCILLVVQEGTRCIPALEANLSSQTQELLSLFLNAPLPPHTSTYSHLSPSQYWLSWVSLSSLDQANFLACLLTGLIVTHPLLFGWSFLKSLHFSA